MCYYYDCELKFENVRDNRVISFLRIYEGKELWSRRRISEKVISQIKVKRKGTKKNHKNSIPLAIKQMNTAIRKAKKIYPDLQKA